MQDPITRAAGIPVGMDLDLSLLAAGVFLHLAADGVRNRAWYGIVRTACPAPVWRVRDVQAAAFAGGGINGVVPARAGDALKIALLRRHAPGVSLATLATTLAADSLLEGVIGVALIAWAAGKGLIPLPPIDDHATLAGVGALAALVLLVAAIAPMRRRLPRAVAGLTVLGHPRTLITRVLSWQLLGRAFRLPAIACCLAACGLPAGLGAALLVMSVEGAARVRFAPVSGSLRLSLLAYGLPEMTGASLAPTAVLVYLTVVTATRAGAGLVVGAAALGHELRTVSPRRLAAAAMRLVRRDAGPHLRRIARTI